MEISGKAIRRIEKSINKKEENRMNKATIIHVMSEAVEKKLLEEWHHDGRIEVEHSDSFDFKLDGRTYRVLLNEVDR